MPETLTPPNPASETPPTPTKARRKSAAKSDAIQRPEPPRMTLDQAARIIADYKADGTLKGRPAWSPDDAPGSGVLGTLARAAALLDAASGAERRRCSIPVCWTDGGSVVNENADSFFTRAHATGSPIQAYKRARKASKAS